MAERTIGTSGYTFRSLLGHTFNMATGYSILPLRLVTWLGLFISVFGVVALVAVLALYWAGVVQVAGFTTVVAMLAVLSGAIMLSLGVLGEYLGRLHVRSMQRPAYLVRPSLPDVQPAEARLATRPPLRRGRCRPHDRGNAARDEGAPR